jgi:hypothetical protein
MKISEMEYHHGEYTSLEGKIKKMQDNREFPAIFSVCIETFPHIVPAIQYRKKREIEPEMPDWSAFDIICTYAPPLFEHAAIESLFEFVKSTRVLAKHDIGFFQAVETAIEHEEIARVLWHSIDQQPNALQKDIAGSLEYNQQTCVKIIDTWEELGVIIRNNEDFDSKIRLRSRLDEVVEGRCHNCGVQGKGRKELFYKSISCQKCGYDSYYYIKYPDTQ